jgi:FkbM family methyltransferase
VDRATNHWALYGSTEVDFNGIRFKSYSEVDDHVASALYYGKPINERRDLGCFLRFAQRSKVILDIGANVGIYSVLSSKANTSATIFSFEPNPINAERLKVNIDINNLRNVRVVQKAVGDQNGAIRFTVPVSNIISDSSSVLESFSKNTYDGNLEWKSVEVEQTTVDNFVRAEDLSRVDLLKIDVEGYEIAVFKGATEMIKEYHPVIQCEIFVDDSRKEFFDRFLQEHSYTAYMLLNEGLLRLDQGIQKEAGSNFVLIRHHFPDLLTPVEKAIEELY